MTTTPDEAVIGGYRLLARIGEGGMGIVHLARKQDSIDGEGPRVALKVLRPHVIGDAEARERLAQEVSSLSRVHSARVAAILDADPYGETPYVVTRYVPGYSLNQHIEEEGLIEGADLTHFAVSLAEALEAVHAVGVLHRDVKPSNVLMEGRSPVLIDFGLARAAEDPKLTITGFMLGTPGYLPPEVLYGERATAAGDIYAWAATVAFAATGRPPFGTGHTMAILDRVRRGEHDLSGVPGPLAGLLARALAVEPHQRPGIGEVLGTLRGQQATSDNGTPHLSTQAIPMTSAWTADPPTTVLPVPTPATMLPPEPVTAIRPVTRRELQEPAVGPASLLPARPTGSERVLRGLQRLGAAALVATATTFAPYPTLAALAATVLLARTASVTRQRHRRRRDLRGRPRWFDVPTTAMSLPGYLVLAAGGAVLLLGFAGLLALGGVATMLLLDKSTGAALLVGGLIAAPALWWGPGSSRVRELLDPPLRANARNPGSALIFTSVCAVLAGVLLAATLMQGTHWWPGTGVPW